MYSLRTLFLCRSVDGKVRRYDIRSGKLICDTVGREFVCTGREAGGACGGPEGDTHSYMQSPLSMHFVRACRCALSFSTSAPVTSVSFSRDGQCVLASTLDSKLRLIDKDTGELLNTLALSTEVHGVLAGVVIMLV